MNTSDIIRALCKKYKVSISELARRIGQSPQNLYKKLKRDTVSYVELQQIAEAFGARYEQSFILPDGEKIKTGDKE